MESHGGQALGKNGFTQYNGDQSAEVLSAAFSPSGTRIARASADHKIRVYDAGADHAWLLLDQWRGHDGEVNDVSQPGSSGISHFESMPKGKMDWPNTWAGLR